MSERSLWALFWLVLALALVVLPAGVAYHVWATDHCAVVEGARFCQMP